MINGYNFISIFLIKHPSVQEVVREDTPQNVHALLVAGVLASARRVILFANNTKPY